MTLLEKITELYRIKDDLKSLEAQKKNLEQEILESKDFEDRMDDKWAVEIWWVKCIKINHPTYSINKNKTEEFATKYPENVKATFSVAWLKDEIKKEYFDIKYSQYIKIDLS